MGPDSRADDGVDGGERRGALEDDHVALVGVVEAVEQLADTTPAVALVGDVEAAERLADTTPADALVGVAEAAERLADTTPARLEVTRLLHVPRFVIALRQRTLQYHADSLTE